MRQSSEWGTAARASAALALCVVLGGCGGESKQASPTLAPGPFNGDTAMAYVRAQLAFGARVPGTEGAVKGGDWIVEQMRLRADSVVEQRWEHVTASGRKLPLRNILARFNPGAAERVLYVTHWDSRPRSESASDTARQRLPVPGANDGASGVALFVALGDLLKRTPPRIGVDLLFVDGEDYGEFGPPDVDVLLGSKYFVEHLPEPGYQPLFGVLWDMIGDRDLKIEQEANSLRAAPEVVTLVWETARSLGYGDTFLPTEGLAITDDHIPFIEKGLHVIDVIDLDFPWHHTPDDTIDKISAASLKRVGDVAWALLQR